MIHTLAVLNTDGVVALCQHYDRSVQEDQIAWETTLVAVIFGEDGGAVREACFKSDVVRVVGCAANVLAVGLFLYA